MASGGLIMSQELDVANEVIRKMAKDSLAILSKNEEAFCECHQCQQHQQHSIGTHHAIVGSRYFIHEENEPTLTSSTTKAAAELWCVQQP